ncbi:MAG: sigma-54-dependent Fis family transcriptional regulator [Myxococcales bacterium]|nr:MAG: sigma-54-dependent Fis family transcriptional regulator [Myxococcales bacterium]
MTELILQGSFLGESMAGQILIIDDDKAFGSGLARNLRGDGHEVSVARNAKEARLAMSQEADAVVLDYQLPDGNGINLLQELKSLYPNVMFIMVTAFPDVDIAVQAMRGGAFDYVSKGSDIRESLLRIERGVDVATLKRQVAETALQDEHGTPADQMLLGKSPQMHRLRETLDALAVADNTTVLVSGETGTGKSLIARIVHGRSKRRYEPFVAVDCTTIPTTLIESELFGHQKGAFSGAIKTKQGRVEVAGNGTLFLDEIGELDLAIQTKLLRLIEEREFTRVGGTHPLSLRARIITATNRNLSRAVEEGRFRQDLRFRLEVFVVEVPTLRERSYDIALLANHFVQEQARALGREGLTLDGEVLALMERYPFPGNIRELKNMIAQAALLARDALLGIDEFPVLRRVKSGWSPPIQSQRPSSRPLDSTPPRYRLSQSPESTLKDSRPLSRGSRPPYALSEIRKKHQLTEKQNLIEALSATGGNVTQAAKQLGLSRFQLMRRLKKYQLDK